jgi:hypothetical protein
VCPQIIKVYDKDELLTRDIPKDGFTDDVLSVVMFRGLEEGEYMSGQSFADYKKFGIAVNDESYEPGLNVTRAEFIKMIVRALSCRYKFDGTDTGFSDIPQDAWHAGYIKFAVDNNWVNGYGDGTFGPNNPITRAEAAKIITNAIELETVEYTQSSFLDVPSESSFAPYIETLKMTKVIGGKTKTTFEPNANITRAEVARIIYKTFLG